MTTATAPDFSKLIAKGYEGINPRRHETILADVAALGFEVQREEWGTFTLTLYLGPQNMTTRQRLDRESQLMQLWGNPPHNLATDFTLYRMTFHAND